MTLHDTSVAYAAIQTPQRVHFGSNAIEKVVEELDRMQTNSVLIVTDAIISKQPFYEKLITSLNARSISWHVVDHVAAEPSVQDVEQALAQTYQSGGAASKVIVAIGGGSVMDTAKLISVLIDAPYTLRDLLDRPQLATKRCLTIMIPTTCGTGSEATGNAIVAIPEQNTKKGIVNPALIPDVVLLDPITVATLPKHIVGATAVDALAHCVECATGKKATPLSDTYATAGARLIFGNIVKAYRDNDMQAKSYLLLGAYYGGVAITGSGTTAVHALSYPLGGRYHIPHGVSNAILLADIMDFNQDACTDQLARMCDAVFPEKYVSSKNEKATALVQAIADIVKDVEIPTSLKHFGIRNEDLEDLVEAAAQQQRLLTNNPKQMNASDIRNIYLKVMD